MKPNYISFEEAKKISTMNRMKDKVEEYETALKELPYNRVGTLEAKDEAEAKSVKRSLIQVAKLLDMEEMKVRRAGKVVMFHRKSEEKESKSKKKESKKAS